MKKLSFLISLMLLACQATPPATAPFTPTAASPVLGPHRPAQPLTQTGSPRFPLAELEKLESASGQVRSGAAGDSLSLKVRIQRPAMRIQAFDLTRIKWLKALVKGPDLTRTYTNQNGEDGFVAVDDTENSLSIAGVPKGKNRVVSVQAYTDPLTPDGEPQLLEGVVLKAIYSSQSETDQEEIVVTFTLQSTLAANVLEELIETDPELAEEVDSEALTTLINQISQGPNTPPSETNPFEGTPLPPGRLDPEGIAESIIENTPPGSPPVIPDTPSTTLPPEWVTPSQAVEVTIEPAGTTYLNHQIVVQIGDSASAPQNVNAEGQSVQFPNIPPGTWEITASVQTQGSEPGQSVIVAQERLKVIVPEDGGPISFTTLTGEPVASPLLTLPPVLTRLEDEDNAPQQTFPGGSVVVIRGDGFDTSNGGANNEVIINGQVVPLAPGYPVTASTLAVILPPELAGTELDVQVTTQEKPSGTLPLAILPVVVSIDNPVLNGSASTPEARTRELSVAGFNPEDYSETLQLQFLDANGDPLPTLVTPTSIDGQTITVVVPAGAGTGAIGVILTPNTPALPSPVLTVVTTPPSITSSNHTAIKGESFTITGENFLTGTNQYDVPLTTVQITGCPLTSADYTIIDENTIEIDVPARCAGLNPGQSYEFTVATALGFDTDQVKLLLPPTVTETDWPEDDGPIVITGSHFVPGQTTVTVNGQTIPANEVTVTETTVTLTNPPADLPAGSSVVITTPAGSVTTILSLYSNLVNFIGNTESIFYEGQTLNYASSVVDYDVLDPHGITVHGCEAIYTVSNAYRLLYKFGINGQFMWSRTLPYTSEDVSTDTTGTVYIASTSGNRIDRYDASGTLLDPLPTAAGTVLGPEGLEISADNRYLYVSSNSSPNTSTYNSLNTVKVLQIDLQNTVDHDNNASTAAVHPVTVIAGSAQRQTAATGNEAIGGALFHHLEGLGMDANNNIYVAEADGNFRQIRKIDRTNQIVSVHASFPAGFAIHEIRVEPDGTVIVPGEGSQKIYRVDPDGTVTTIAGTGGVGLKQGAPETATFATPVGVDFDPDGNLYIADRNWGIRKIERLAPRSGTTLCD